MKKIRTFEEVVDNLEQWLLDKGFDCKVKKKGVDYTGDIYADAEINCWYYAEYYEYTPFIQLIRKDPEEQEGLLWALVNNEYVPYNRLKLYIHNGLRHRMARRGDWW